MRKTDTITANAAEQALFRDLLGAYERAKRDVEVAWTVFSAGRELARGTELEGVNDLGLIVTLPDV